MNRCDHKAKEPGKTSGSPKGNTAPCPLCRFLVDRLRGHNIARLDLLHFRENGNPAFWAGGGYRESSRPSRRLDGETVLAPERKCQRGAGKAGCPVGVSLTAVLMLLGSDDPAWGYRPLTTTDASVVEPQAVEIEFGYFTLEQADKEKTFIGPQVTTNYGLSRNWELSGELLAEKPPGTRGRFVSPAVFLKRMLREGTLQNTQGMRIAVEAGLLLPSADPAQKRVGMKGVGVLSGVLPPFTYHLNLGGGVDREKTTPFILWGAAAEWSLFSRVRLIGEINGESSSKESPDTSALVGVIWQSPWSPLVFDGGIRKGISREASDWSFTLGLTWNFSFPLGIGP